MSNAERVNKYHLKQKAKIEKGDKRALELKERKKISGLRSVTRRFIRNYATEKDLDEIKNLIKCRKDFLSSN